MVQHSTLGINRLMIITNIFLFLKYGFYMNNKSMDLCDANVDFVGGQIYVK